MSTAPPMTRPLGETGIRIWPFALDASVFGWAAGPEQTAAVLDRFAEAGGNLISTADHYAGGRSEVMIGSWLRTAARDRVVIATKIGRHPDAQGLSPRAMERAVEASLERLGTDYIDILSLDGEDPHTPIDETLEKADLMIRAGKVRHLSVSAFAGERIREITEFARPAAYPTFRCVAAVYNLMQRATYERDLAPVVNDLGLNVIVRYPVASGYLTGRFRHRDDHRGSPMFADAFEHIGRRGDRVLACLDQVASELGESPARVAVAWCQSKPGVLATALRVQNEEELAAYLHDGELVLSRQHVAQLDAASS